MVVPFTCGSNLRKQPQYRLQDSELVTVTVVSVNPRSDSTPTKISLSLSLQSSAVEQVLDILWISSLGK